VLFEAGGVLNRPGSFACHVCHADAVIVVDHYEQLQRVTSDCKTWPRGGTLGECSACGAIQKAFDPDWARECAEVYQQYEIYHQSGTASEQAVFDAVSGQPSSRSNRLLDVLAGTYLGPRGRLVDIGCGNGEFLRAVSSRLPEWMLDGMEIDDRHRATVEAIPRVGRLYTGTPDALPGQCDAAVMIHALEHIVEPIAFLQAVSTRLNPGARLVLEVPDAAANPFDLLIVDHATHFTMPVLTSVVERAGYEVLFASDSVVPKELTLVARLTDPPVGAAPWKKSGAGVASQWVAWLETTARMARASSTRIGGSESFGLFGTSIAATWLASEVGAAVGFFVDEDPNRAGRSFMGRPVLRPVDLREGTTVFVGLAPSVASPVALRLRQELPHVLWVEPPALP
jgi:SAM-dependent methyltransferase